MGSFPVQGHCDERFARVRETFEKNFTDGEELGSSFALTIEGELVVDLWGGFASADRSKAWEKDTIVPVSSSSKIPVALCGLMLIDRGLIDPDKPIANYWPEFAANGKENVLVRHAFSHSAGLPAVEGMPGFDVLGTFSEAARRIGAQKTWWEPGTKSGYHGFSFGTLIGELVRRSAGKTINEFFRDEVASQLAIDFRFGIDDSTYSRMAEIVWEKSDDGDSPEIPKDSIYYRALGYLMEQVPVVDFWNHDIPAGNGITNARALSQIGNIVANMGQYHGHRILQPETVERAWQEEIYVRDLIFGAPVRYGLGFGLASKEVPMPWEHTMHWGGAGGSSIFMVPEVKASFAYTPNRFCPGRGVLDHRGAPLKDAVVSCLT
jgi:CubicO group peptidase (beta-lactamase class C family)